MVIDKNANEPVLNRVLPNIKGFKKAIKPKLITLKMEASKKPFPTDLKPKAMKITDTIIATNMACDEYFFSICLSLSISFLFAFTGPGLYAKMFWH